MRRFLLLTALVMVLSGVFFALSWDGEGFAFEYSSAEAQSILTFIPSINRGDIENQKPLPDPPAVIKAVYATAWTAGGKGMERLIEFIKSTELNAVVIDIKDYSGIVSYDIQVPEVLKYKAKEVRTPRINALLKRLHDEGIYVIARQTVFQDPALVKARPDLAVQNKNTGRPWADQKGLSWADPASGEVWEYNIAIAKDALARGFDEINFDYIRFPTDGATKLMQYPFYDPVTTYKKDVIREFFRHLRASLPGARISADLFGQTTVDYEDMGIGQIIEYAYESFDYVAPMVYPSHFIANFLGYKNPATNPYEVIKYTSDLAFKRLRASGHSSKLRPWLQDFDLGGVAYGADKVSAQIRAVHDSSAGYENLYGGWMLWDPANIYTPEALQLD